MADENRSNSGWYRWGVTILLLFVLLQGIELVAIAILFREDNLFKQDYKTGEVWRQNIDRRMERLLTAIEYASPATIEELRETAREIREEIRQERKDARGE